MTDHEKLIGKVEYIITQAQQNIEAVQTRLTKILAETTDPKILSDVLGSQARAVKTLAEATRILADIKKQGEETSDTTFFE